MKKNVSADDEFAPENPGHRGPKFMASNPLTDAAERDIWFSLEEQNSLLKAIMRGSKTPPTPQKIDLIWEWAISTRLNLLMLDKVLEGLLAIDYKNAKPVFVSLNSRKPGDSKD